MKILWHSNAPFAATGYGMQTAIWSQLLAEEGHEVAVSCFYGLAGAMLNWNGVKLYPGGAHPYGNDLLPAHAADHFGGDLRAGLIITLVDAWVLDAPSLSRANVACWTPVDHDPAPPQVVAFFESSGATPIAMSRHGERMLRDAGLDPLYVPHGINTDLFAPGDRDAAKDMVNVPRDAFLVGMVAANKGYPSRKGFGQAVAAFEAFRQRHDDAYLFIHTEPTAVFHGVDLPALLTAHGVPEDRVRFCDRYRNMIGGFAPEVLAAAYNAMDVLLNPSYGEGFGIPVVEAQACGTPVIVTDWTAMSELGEVGWHVSGERTFTSQGSFWMVPETAQIVAALEQAYTMAPRMRERAREFAVAYDARRVLADHWRPALERLADLVEAPRLPGVVEIPAGAAA